MFKDDLQTDLPLFVETEEFAEEVDVDGVRLPAQVCPISKARSELVRDSYPKLEGEFVELYFRTSDYTATRKRLPHYSEWCFVNGKRFEVVSSQDELGICRLELAAYRQPTLR